MTLTEKIIKKIESLPEEKKFELYDFISYLESTLSKKEDENFKSFSLESAMKGLEYENIVYSIKDIKEKF